MARKSRRNFGYFIALLVCANASCMQLYGQQGQGNSPRLHKSVLQPKLLKTQGSSEYDNVHAMIQDKHAHLWIATTGEGVYRYDGEGFRQYTQKDGLSSNTVYSILEDSTGTIWFGTEKGISRYDGESIYAVPFSSANYGKQINFAQAQDEATLHTNEVWSIMQDKLGVLWFGADDGLYCYNGIAFTRLLSNFRIVNSNALKLKKIQCMMQDRKGTIWLGSGLGEAEGLCSFDGEMVAPVEPKVDDWIRQVWEDKKGAIWLSTRRNGLWRDEDGRGFVEFSNKDARVSDVLRCNQAMIEDKLGNMWFAGGETIGTNESNGGIWRFDGSNFKNYSVKDGLGSFSIWSMLEDNAGHIWVGTRNTGLYRFDGSRFVPFSD